MLATLLLMFMIGGEPTGGCAIEGTVVLRRAGEKVSPYGRVVVYLDERGPPKEEVKTLTQKNLQFDQPVLVMQRNDRLRVLNEDNQEHNVFANEGNRIDPEPVSKGKITTEQPLGKSGATRVQCDIHGWMRTDVLVLKGPWFDHVQNDEGRFRIVGVPPGKHTLLAWEPNGATTKPIQVSCGKAPLLTLDEAPEPVLRRSDGNPYPDIYQGDRGPKTERFRPEKQ